MRSYELGEMVPLYEMAIVGKHHTYAVSVCKRVVESDLCPHGCYKGCEECAEEYRAEIDYQYRQYYAGIF